MSDPDDALEIDIESELRGLFEQAEQDLGVRAVSRSPTALPKEPAPELKIAAIPAPAPSELEATLAGLLKPLVSAIEGLSRQTEENSIRLQKLEGGEEAGTVIGDLRGLLEAKTGVTQRMFDALHEELRGYKDGFLIEAFHKPVIRDLITLYDDLGEIYRQFVVAFEEHVSSVEPGSEPIGLLKRWEVLVVNLSHHRAFVLELLARLDVMPMPPGTGKLDKRSQRPMSVEPTTDLEEDGMVVRSLKEGFLWKERVIRPEEVVTKKWKEPEASE